MITIADLEITESELNVLFNGVFSSIEDYNSEPISKVDKAVHVVNLYLLRNEPKKAKQVVDSINELDRADYYPEGLIMRI